ncbi:hypothetical protein A1O1_08297 [Capronia coronata CBS 617.96]|uniref:Dihydroxyacetone kinase n=1 Tax=Capronia coronata CBS 617.96 TaxID=1182541 RepID=W9XS33_9EURO|nr:uncharacterized protein A1O1_08297 [Capronia coronata CBS 617.96]EXJ80155.1 hypothetical protein A1O1_08297 [Capronia coronata CBS 617.96]
MNTKHFFNDPESLVQDALQGLVYANPHLSYDPDNKCVIDSQHDGSKFVTLISGGGAGHEPAFAGYVGPNLLNAAISGFIFASPSVQQIVNTIAHAGGSTGTLLIIMNYTGDVLHFHLAAEKARVAGHHTAVMTVGDDVSVGRKRSGRVGRRGLAGTVLVHKILGGYAKTGASLDEVVKFGEQVCNNLVTVGAALDHVHVPGRETNKQASNGSQVELGMGIHNEPGCRVLEPQPHINDLVNQMLDQLLDPNDSDRAYVRFGDCEPVVLLVNNLGGLSPLEFSAVTKIVSEELRARVAKVARIYAAPFMTSLDSKGFSISLLKANQEMLHFLDVPVTAPGWAIPTYSSESWERPNGPSLKQKGVDTQVHDLSRSTLELAPSTLKRILTSCCDSILSVESLINSYDSVVGDGDCGSTLGRAARAIQSTIQSSPSAFGDGDAVQAIETLARVLEDNMDGTSGALYAIFFNALAASLKNIGTERSGKRQIKEEDWSRGVSEALDALYRATPARVGDRTLVDALEPFIKTFATGKGVHAAVIAATNGKEKTKGMSAAFGRAVYVPESAWSEVPDPGAEGVVRLVQGLLTDGNENGA